MRDQKPATATEQEKFRIRRVEILISTILRVGVVASLGVVIFGTIVTFAHHRDYVSSPVELQNLVARSAEFPDKISEVLSGAAHFEERAIVIVGLLLLIATPVLRVAVSIFAFVYQRDRVFVAITSVVLVLLLLSFLLGKAGG